MDATLRDTLDPEGDQPLRRGRFDLLSPGPIPENGSFRLSDPSHLDGSSGSGKFERFHSLFMRLRLSKGVRVLAPDQTHRFRCSVHRRSPTGTITVVEQ